MMRLGVGQIAVGLLKSRVHPVGTKPVLGAAAQRVSGQRLAAVFV